MSDEIEQMTMSEMIAKKICSNHKQHVIMMIEGKTGTGKSYAAMDLAYNTSLQMADRLGGHPTDYFNLDHIAVITPDEVVRVSKSIKKHGIYILDDIGVGLSSRKWQSKGNEVLTNILQTFRTQNNLIILTVPDGAFIDKIARKLLHYKVVMKFADFNHGFTVGKLYKVTRSPTKDSQNNMYTFVRGPGIQYNHCSFGKPPQAICDAYDERRETLQQELQNKALQELQDTYKEAEKEITPDQLKAANTTRQVKKIKKYIGDKGMTVNAAIEENKKFFSGKGVKGISRKTYYNNIDILE